MNNFLSKTDFTVARDCAAKLYYRKHHFPTSLDESDFMEMLAYGGYMVGKLAQLLYPAGIEIEGDTDQAIVMTQDLLDNNQEIILFEPAITINNQLIRIDILIKKNNSFDLIEVKSKSFNSAEWEAAAARGKKYWEKTEFQPYLEDVAFQKKVLQEKFPEAEVHGFLILPDTAKSTHLDGVVSWFSISENSDTGFNKTKASFIGTDQQLSALRQDNVLALVDVDEWIDPMIAEIAAEVPAYIDSILHDERINVQISCKCKGCEYTVTDEKHQTSGFENCWGALSKPKPHILELGRLGNINKKKGMTGCIDALIIEGKTGLSDVPRSYVANDDDTPYFNDRPLYQLTENKEFLLGGFWDAIANIEYPLHFIDFETSQMALPYHSGMHAYGKVIFQWSCHTIESPGAEPEHSGWLNTESYYPNIDFAKTLRNQLGDRGTCLTWSSYENTQLRSIHGAIGETGADEGDLKKWLEDVAQFDKADTTRLLDMNKLALLYYFHPLMGGRTSIKVTLPAVLQSFTSARIKNWLEKDNLYERKDDGSVTDPYKLLPEPAPIFDGKSVKVNEGGGAMLAYQDMVYGIHKNDRDVRTQYSEALEKYCKLDTLAMVIIWEHWMSLRNR
jgi:hypothetical protein